MIVFSNVGEIDPTSIKTFGVSSKEGANAIGFFGTGLKYAIAILLRTGHKVTIYSGEHPYEFSLERQRVRVDDFDLVTMNGEKLAFTTELGKTWELWQAYRELLCNALDEGGTVTETSTGDDVTPTAGRTYVVVEGRGLEQLHRDNDVMLTSAPLVRLPEVSIHPGPSKYMYYQGIRAAELPRPSLFTYNITVTTALTEDRTLKSLYSETYRLGRQWLQVDLEELLHTALGCSDDFYEHGLDFTWPEHKPNPVFQQVVLERYSNFKAVSASAIEACRDAIMSNVDRHKALVLDGLDQQRLDKAIAFNRGLGYPVDEYPIVVTDFMGNGVLGRAAEGTIFLSDRVFKQGTKQVAATLLEEFIHLRYRLPDNCYEMQSFLFDVIMSTGERALGEAL